MDLPCAVDVCVDSAVEFLHLSGSPDTNLSTGVLRNGVLFTFFEGPPR